MSGKEPWDGIICPTCFAVLAEQEGVARNWVLFPQTVLEGQKLFTPDGRFWNEDTWRWEYPQPFDPERLKYWPEGA